MKDFGAPFTSYQTLEVADFHVLPSSFDDTASKRTEGGRGPKLPYGDESAGTSGPARSPFKGFLTISDTEKKEILKKIKVGASTTANIYAISPDQKDLSEAITQNMRYFNYYVVELGLNVKVGQEAKIPQLHFDVNLRCDSKQKDDLTTNSIAPTDEISKRKIVDGTVKIGISKLLQFIPVVGGVVSEIIAIDINPIEFKAELKNYVIDATGAKTPNPSWLLYGTDTAQNFNPLMILKARKNVTAVWATVRVKYILEKYFRKAEIDLKPLKVNILPI